MKRIMLLLVGLLPPLWTQIVWAESVYVIDRLSVALYSGPLNQEPVVKRVNSGDMLEVVERLENAIKVRDSSGVEGWLESKYVMAEKPATLLLGAARERAERAALELKATKEQMISLKGRLQEAENALTEEKNRASDLATQLTAQMNQVAMEHPAVAKEPEPREEGQESVSGFSIPWFLATLAALGIGFGAGIAWVRETYKRRLGGMYLRI